MDPSLVALATNTALTVLRAHGWSTAGKQTDPAEKIAIETPGVAEEFESAVAREGGKAFADWILGKLRRRAAQHPTGAEAARAAVEPRPGIDPALVRDQLVAALLEAFAGEPGLADDVRARLQQVHVEASGVRSVAIGGSNSGQVNTGDVTPT